jgi:diguanylate cyclase (GGDEF)-like protein
MRRERIVRGTVSDDWDDTVAAIPGDFSDAGPPQAYLVVVRGANVGETHPVTGPSMVIGRGAGVDLRVNDEGVSRFHCKLHDDTDGIYVEDLGSRNGTYCNGDRLIPGLRRLSEGDRLQIGTTIVFRFTYVESTGMLPKVEPETDTRDRLTGALSRRAFMDRMDAEVAQALSNKAPLSLVLVHIDRFGEIAADQGQPELDRLTMSVASQIRENVRREDLLARFGPGDFGLASLWASPGDTYMFAERLRKRAEAPITLSIGIAAMSELVVHTAQDLLLAAGSALHRARSQGGNRSVLCTPDLLGDPKARITIV